MLQSEMRLKGSLEKASAIMAWALFHHAVNKQVRPSSRSIYCSGTLERSFGILFCLFGLCLILCFQMKISIFWNFERIIYKYGLLSIPYLGIIVIDINK